MPQYRIEPLSGQSRRSFSCGVEALDRYFHNQVTQDIRRRATACFVAIDSSTDGLAGYYTLAAGAVPLFDLPDILVKQLPRYPSVPVARLGRLAVVVRYRGLKLGAALLWDAAVRAARSDLMAFGMIVDAKDEPAESFYSHHGFVQLGARKLILPFGRDMLE
jgi:GNAT superfamily N-acetyltransferase